MRSSITNDYNLNRVAHVEGVEVLNVNELANAVKPVVFAGRRTARRGDSRRQRSAIKASGYLDDGTMIVVEHGRRLIGEETDVVVTSVLQTVAGRMIFARTRSARERRFVKWGAVDRCCRARRRLGRPKQFIELAGLPMVGWSHSNLSLRCAEIVELVIVTEPESIEPDAANCGAARAPNCRIASCAAVRRGKIARVKRHARRRRECEAVLVHDGARPIDYRATTCAPAWPKCAPAVDRCSPSRSSTPSSGSIRSRSASFKRSSATRLWAAQTPQFAHGGRIACGTRTMRARLALRSPTTPHCSNASGFEVIAVAPSSENFKVTIAPDVARAESILLRRAQRLAVS